LFGKTGVKPSPDGNRETIQGYFAHDPDPAKVDGRWRCRRNDCELAPGSGRAVVMSACSAVSSANGSRSRTCNDWLPASPPIDIENAAIIDHCAALPHANPQVWQGSYARMVLGIRSEKPLSARPRTRGASAREEGRWGYRSAICREGHAGGKVRSRDFRPYSTRTIISFLVNDLRRIFFPRKSRCQPGWHAADVGA